MDGHWIMQVLSMCNLVKTFGTTQQYIIFGSLLSYENEIFSSLNQKANMIEQSQQQRKLDEKDPSVWEQCLIGSCSFI